jgi:C1A family cysteine protease
MKNNMGWRPSLPDYRDYVIGQHPVLMQQDFKEAQYDYHTALPGKVDYRQYVPWINDQGDLGSCTANAGQSLMGFMERVAYGGAIPGSRIFLYAVTRYLMNRGIWTTGDTGADIRNTLGALVIYGLPPESFCKYDPAKFDKTLDPALYGLADDYRALKYFRHDTQGKSNAQVLQSIKTQISGKIPTVFGFTCYSSIDSASDGKIPFPGSEESVEGGHAILAIGYDDNFKIGQCAGALLIQNSWGKNWGEGGFGWLPYDYVLKGLASDFWSVSSASYVETGQFGF